MNNKSPIEEFETLLKKSSEEIQTLETALKITANKKISPGSPFVATDVNRETINKQLQVLNDELKDIIQELEEINKKVIKSEKLNPK